MGVRQDFPEVQVQLMQMTLTEYVSGQFFLCQSQPSPEMKKCGHAQNFQTQYGGELGRQWDGGRCAWWSGAGSGAINFRPQSSLALRTWWSGVLVLVVQMHAPVVVPDWSHPSHKPLPVGFFVESVSEIVTKKVKQ